MANVFNLALPEGSSSPDGVSFTSGGGVQFIDNVGVSRTQAGVDAGTNVRLLVDPLPLRDGVHELTAVIHAIGAASEQLGVFYRYVGDSNSGLIRFYPFANPARIDVQKTGPGSFLESTTVPTPNINDVITIGVSLSGSTINVLYNGSVINSVTSEENMDLDTGRYYTESYGAAISELNYNQALTNSAPTALLGANQNITTGIEFTADASGSSDVDNDAITYSYVLTTPVGSSATLEDATTASPRFTPDVDGEYTLTLTVNDGTEDSAPVSQVLTAYTAEQAITMNDDFISVIGDPVSLQCALSGYVTAISWSITQAPAGSTAAISNPSANPASFTPDVTGLYEATVTATTASGSEFGTYYFRVGDSLERGVPTAYISTNGEPLPGKKITLIARGA